MIRLLLLTLCTASFALAAAEAVPPVTVKQLMKTTKSWDGAPLHYPQGEAEVTAVEITIAPGAELGWHSHPAPAFGLILEGDWQVMLKDGTTKTFHAGDPISEVVDTLHNGRNLGTTPARLLAFFAGTVGQKLTQPEVKGEAKAP